MSDGIRSFDDRRRAESFGSAAAAYDRWRPRYPEALIDALDVGPGSRVLDVGAGTGIASTQLAATGAEVLAVEPDEQMAEIARSTGLAVEVAPFERWDPAGRTFDVVTFAQSFHWVDPVPSLATIADILTPRGRLGLLWNRIRPVEPSLEELDAVHAELRGPDTAAVVGGTSQDQLLEMLSQSGFDVEERRAPVEMRYDAESYVEMLFTYSRQLILDADTRARLRARLTAIIGSAGVTAVNDAIALICTRRM
ncbi:class I SAM-dependent methyltransferase [Williamsia sp. SKLECPSW1]